MIGIIIQSPIATLHPPRTAKSFIINQYHQSFIMYSTEVLTIAVMLDLSRDHSVGVAGRRVPGKGRFDCSEPRIEHDCSWSRGWRCRHADCRSDQGEDASEPK